MTFGIIEVITLLLGMAGFGLQANPSAPTADQALAYAMPDADLAAHIDVASVVPGNYKLLALLADQPQIKPSPELQQLVRKTIGEVEAARGVAKLATDLDVTSDIADATAFVRFSPQAKPVFVVAVHGRFSPANLDAIARSASRTVQSVGTGALVDGGADDPAIGLTKDGVLLIGTIGLVRDRLAPRWKAPSHAPGTSLGYLAEVIDAKPVFALTMTMSPTARKLALGHLGAHNFGADVVTRHKAASLSVFRDGVGWTWIDSTAAGLDAVELVSNGAIDLLRAAQIAPRGLAKIAMGSIDSYRGTNPQVDDMIKRKADILRIIETYTGDGSFKVASDKNPKALRLTVRATGKTVSEVLPIGLVVPGALLAYVGLRPEPMERAAPDSVAKPNGGKAPVKPAPVTPAPVKPAPAKRP